MNYKINSIIVKWGSIVYTYVYTYASKVDTLSH